MEQNDTVISIQNAVPRLETFRFKEPINWTIRQGEHWAVIGRNGAGKTLLTDILREKYALKEGEIILPQGGKISEQIKSIAFKDIYSLVDCKNTYYQQRWHATETDEIPTVLEALQQSSNDISSIQAFFDKFGIGNLLHKKVIFLSSGELRKFLIVKVLLSNPRILILDNPFIGLDASSRELLNELLEQMASINGLQIILLLSNPSDIPGIITHILPVQEKRLLPTIVRHENQMEEEIISELFSLPATLPELPLQNTETPRHSVTMRMENVTIRYGSRTILDNLNWEIKAGEKWALLGQNGAGKSTLLSLVYADNPQSYANTIYLFDKKRGSGESIWEIKKRIGYVSPEMHLYYMENVPCIDIVGSGFFDSVGLYRKCHANQRQQAIRWMEVFGIEHLAERSFLSLSSGEQRLALLARAFVKEPDLLILDEPLHGLDHTNKQLARKVIEQYCQIPKKSLIYVTHYLHEIPSCVTQRFELKKTKE